MENKKTAAVLIADGFEEIEAVTVIDILRRADITTQIVSIMDTVEALGAHGIKIMCDCTIDCMDDSDIIILPGGGQGTQKLKKHPIVAEKLRLFNHDKKWLAAVCAAPTVLEELRILDGKTAVCYPTCEQDLKSAVIGSSDVEVCDNVITSKAAGTTAAFAFKIVELLKDKEAALKLQEAMLY